MLLSIFSSMLYDLMEKNTKHVVEKIITEPIDYLVIPFAELLVIILLGLVALKLSSRSIDKVFSFRFIEMNRATTLRKLTKSIVHYTLYFLLALLILLKLGFNPMPILAGAGILGLAIGFGAQNLVKDFFSGFFLILERQIEVGDKVQINGEINGWVEEVGLRTTQVREYNQSLHYIPNGSILQITNYNREKMRSIVQVTVPYEADLEKVEKTLSDVCKIIDERHKNILLEEPIMFGVTNTNQYGVQYMVAASTSPENFFTLEYDMRKEAIIQLRKNEIDFPYQRNILNIKVD